MSKDERTGWRDEALSLRHRVWGHDCPAVDVDFLLIEYDYAKPVALIEYKDSRTAPIIFMHASYRAINILARSCQIPFFIVLYSHNNGIAWRFQIIFKNLQPIDSPKTMNEMEYVTFLYSLRKRTVPENIMKILSVDHPKSLTDFM